MKLNIYNKHRYKYRLKFARICIYIYIYIYTYNCKYTRLCAVFRRSIWFLRTHQLECTSKWGQSIDFCFFVASTTGIQKISIHHHSSSFI